MEKNVNYDIWLESIQKMDEPELLERINNSGGYNNEYIGLIKDRLIKDFGHSQEELDELLHEADAKYQTEKILEETDRPLSMVEKTMVILGLLVFQLFAFFYVLFMWKRKKCNSLGEKRYLYNEASRKWLLSCLFSYVFIWGALYVITIISNIF